MRAARLIGLALLVVAAGCGAQSGDQSDDSTPADTDADEPATRLEVTFWPQGEGGGGTSAKLTLTCDPAGGTAQDPEEACRKLAAFDDPFAPPPTDEVCTEQYGGPEQALIAGTYNGEPVSFRLSRTNGCEIARWEQFAFLLPGGGRA